MSQLSASPAKHEREDNPPFLVRVFHRSGTFHHPDEFTAHSLPPHARIYTWPTTTLNELALQLADAIPGALPSPAIGTRLDFRLVYPDIRQSASASSSYYASHQPQPRYLLKGLGSVVLGEAQQAGGSVARNGDANNNDSDDHPEDEDGDEDMTMGDATAAANHDGEKTLGEAKFVIGDYISCAILPPLSDGSVAPPIAELPPGRMSRGRPGGGGPGGPPRRDPYGGRENGMGRGPSWGGGRRDGGGGGFGGGFDRLPSGEWRRGERLPDPPPSRPRNRHGRY